MTSMLSVTPEIRVNTTYLDTQDSSEIVALADGTYIVVWRSYDNQGGADFDVYMRHYSATGVRLSGEIRVNTTTFLAQGFPAIAATDDGFVVGWNGYSTADVNGIYVQRYDFNLNALGGETRVNIPTFYQQNGLRLAGLPGGGFVATWYATDAEDGDASGVFARVFNADGTGYVGEIQVNSVITGIQDAPDIAVLADGSFVVVWESDGQDLSSYGIFAAHFSSTGARLSGDIAVNNTSAGAQSTPAIAALADGGYVVVWTGNGPGDAQGIFFQRYDSSGAAVGGETLVPASPAYAQHSPDIAAMADGGFVIAWVSMGGQDGSDWAAMGQRYDDAGNRMGSELQLNTYAADAQYDVSVTGLANGGFAATWTSVGQDGSVAGVFGKTWYSTTSQVGTQYLYGTSGADLLDGGSGNDVMSGGGGDDTYVVNATGDRVNEAFDSGQDTVQSSVGWALAANFENLLLTGLANIDGAGNAVANTIIGNGGANVLDGLAGNDVIDGGGGNDNLNGGEGHDVMSGGDGNDVVYASAGRDYADGGNGNDTFAATTYASAVTINLSSGRARLGVKDVTVLTGIENATGGFYNDTLIGDANGNVLDGENGDDIMRGYGGDDTYVVGSALDNVSELIAGVDAGGEDTVIATVSYTLPGYVENLTLLGNTSLFGNGNNLDNTLIGNDYANRLNGLAGADVMYGGAGDDTYVVDDQNDKALEYLSGGNDGGIDLVEQSSGFFSLDLFVENLTMVGAGAITAYGNQSDNVMKGNGGVNSLYGMDGNDTLDGQGGADFMYGGSGDDTYVVDNASDFVSEATYGVDETGNDLVRSSVSYTLGDYVERLTLTGAANINGRGNGLANALAGNGGANRLQGLAGNDVLTGGAGADTFIFEAAGAATNGVDKVMDFISGVDKLSFTGADYGFAAGHVLIASEISFSGVATTVAAQFVFNTATKVLSWDSNGTAAGGLVNIVNLVGVTPALGDFVFT